MAFTGQALTHLPQEMHFSGFTRSAVPSRMIQRAGQTFMQLPQASHLSLSIIGNATGTTPLRKWRIDPYSPCVKQLINEVMLPGAFLFFDFSP